MTYVIIRVSYPQNRISNVIRDEDEDDDIVISDPCAKIVEFQQDLSKLLMRNYIPVDLLQLEKLEESDV